MNNDLRERLYAFEQEFNSSDSDLKENIPSHYQGDVNMYLLDKAGKLIEERKKQTKEEIQVKINELKELLNDLGFDI